MKKLENSFISDCIKQFCSNINLCKSKIENKTKEFSKVLYKKDVSYEDFVIDDMITTSIEISQKLNSHLKKVNLEKK